MGRLALPPWAEEIIDRYESRCANQFVLFGNVGDRFVLPKGGVGGLNDFWREVLTPQFDVVLSYDLGNGVRVEKGAEALGRWPSFKENPAMPKQPRAAAEFLTHFFRYAANLERLGQGGMKIACTVKNADLVAPASPGLDHDLNALALLIRDWSCDERLGESSLVTCLVADNLNDLHPLITRNPRAAAIEIPMPSAEDIAAFVQLLEPLYPVALQEFAGRHAELAPQLRGATLNAVENLLRLKNHRKAPIHADDLSQLKKQLVESECGQLIEFLEPKRSFRDLHAQDKLKERLSQDIELWRQNDVGSLPMGYLLCGPVGTGKTFFVECLAGESGVPVVKIKNFRDKWVGSTEGNLERIFRLLKALGRCFVFIDEADQTLGRRDADSGDSGLSGRVYAMIAKEMGNPDNRGKVVWILASSRPDLIEVDLKRPGRIDLKIPLFPSSSPEEGFALLQTLSRKLGMELDDALLPSLRQLIPPRLTAGSAEALAIKISRTAKTRNANAAESLRLALAGYRDPVSKEVMDFQIGLAVAESTDWEFIPPAFRPKTPKLRTPSRRPEP